MQASFELVDQIFVPFQLKMKLKPTNFGINRQYQINENPVTSLSSLELKQFHDIDNNLKRKLITYFFFIAQQPLVGQGLFTVEASRSHSATPHSTRLLWTSDQPDAETST